MQLNAKTDYAIRIVIYLAGHRGVSSAQDLSASLGIPKTYIFNIVNELRSNGLVASSRGVNGGFYLAKTAEDITLWDIAQVTENTMQIGRPATEEHLPGLPEYRLVDGVYRTIQQQLEAVLKNANVAEILLCAGHSPEYPPVLGA